MRTIAVGDEWPWSSSEKKSVASTATPIELPSCWIAFSVPEAEPTSCVVDAGEDHVEQRPEDPAEADAETSSAGAIVPRRGAEPVVRDGQRERRQRRQR